MCHLSLTSKTPMKISFTHLVVIYILSFCFYLIYATTAVIECSAYWMHDAAIKAGPERIIISSCCLFLPPIMLLLVQKKLHIKTPATYFLIQLVCALLSISLLAFVIDKPLNYNDGVHFVFISLKTAVVYYLLKLLSYIMIGIILIKTIF